MLLLSVLLAFRLSGNIVIFINHNVLCLCAGVVVGCETTQMQVNGKMYVLQSAYAKMFVVFKMQFKK